MEEGGTDRVEVRITLRQYGGVCEHAVSYPYRGARDAAAAVAFCADAVLPGPVAVLAGAICDVALQEEWEEGSEEWRLAEALRVAADAYANHWRTPGVDG